MPFPHASGRVALLRFQWRLLLTFFFAVLVAGRLPAQEPPSEDETPPATMPRMHIYEGERHVLSAWGRRLERDRSGAIVVANPRLSFSPAPRPPDSKGVVRASAISRALVSARRATISRRRREARASGGVVVRLKRPRRSPLVLRCEQATYRWPATPRDPGSSIETPGPFTLREESPETRDSGAPVGSGALDIAGTRLSFNLASGRLHAQAVERLVINPALAPDLFAFKSSRRKARRSAGKTEVFTPGPLDLWLLPEGGQRLELVAGEPGSTPDSAGPLGPASDSVRGRVRMVTTFPKEELRLERAELLAYRVEVETVPGMETPRRALVRSAVEAKTFPRPLEPGALAPDGDLLLADEARMESWIASRKEGETIIDSRATLLGSPPTLRVAEIARARKDTPARLLGHEVLTCRKPVVITWQTREQPGKRREMRRFSAVMEGDVRMMFIPAGGPPAGRRAPLLDTTADRLVRASTLRMTSVADPKTGLAQPGAYDVELEGGAQPVRIRMGALNSRSPRARLRHRRDRNAVVNTARLEGPVAMRIAIAKPNEMLAPPPALGTGTLTTLTTPGAARMEQRRPRTNTPEGKPALEYFIEFEDSSKLVYSLLTDPKRAYGNTRLPSFNARLAPVLLKGETKPRMMVTDFQLTGDGGIEHRTATWHVVSPKGLTLERGEAGAQGAIEGRGPVRIDIPFPESATEKAAKQKP